MERLLLATSIVAFGLIVTVLTSLRRAHIRVEYSVSWLAASTMLFLLAQWPWLLQTLGNLIGVPDPALSLLFLILAVFLVVFYRFSMIISHLKDTNIALTQRLAIIEFRLESIEDQHAEQAH